MRAAKYVVDFLCPHCQAELEDCDDIVDWYSPSTWDRPHVVTCPVCSNRFTVTAEVTAKYETSKELPKPEEPSPYRRQTIIPLKPGVFDLSDNDIGNGGRALLLVDGLPSMEMSFMEALKYPKVLK